MSGVERASVLDHGNSHPIAVAKRAAREAEKASRADSPQAAGVAIAYALIAVAEQLGAAAETVRNG